LDDFGTGHSSLYRLQSLPFHTLKIDRSFVLPLDQGDDVMVRTVTDLARELQVDMVAEGVETHTQLQALVRLGIAQVQGFVGGPPHVRQRSPALVCHQRIRLWQRFNPLRRGGGLTGRAPAQPNLEVDGARNSAATTSHTVPLSLAGKAK
jgi:hypothetical protein